MRVNEKANQQISVRTKTKHRHKIIPITGYYGARNFGDNFIYQSAVEST